MSSELRAMEQLIQRVTTLEVKHEERHQQTLNIMERLEQTQERIAQSVGTLAENQSKMAHLGSKSDDHDAKIEAHEKWLTKIAIEQERLSTRQTVLWAAAGTVITVCIGVAVRLV